MFNRDELKYVVTVPSGSSYMQSLGIEFLITFYLMFAVSGIAFDKRAVSSFSLHDFLIFHIFIYIYILTKVYLILNFLNQIFNFQPKELVGLVVGGIVTVNSLFAGYSSNSPFLIYIITSFSSKL